MTAPMMAPFVRTQGDMGLQLHKHLHLHNQKVDSGARDMLIIWRKKVTLIIKVCDTLCSARLMFSCRLATTAPADVQHLLLV